MKRLLLLLFFLMVLGITLLSCRTFSSPSVTATAPAFSSPVQAATTSPYVIPPVADLVSLEDTLIEIYKEVNPGVVAIRALTEEGESQGSGFVIDMDGHIVTNYHVVEDLTGLEVAFPSGYKARGEVLGTDLDSDLAVIKVDVPLEELHPLQLSDSEQVRVGQTVIAIGNPFGFKGTMTMGIISGLGRTMQSLHEAPGGGKFSTGDIIQTDAAINPGNSGGPLLNLSGEAIGVNRAIYTTNFSAEGEPMNSGVGFAISINIVKRVVPSLIATGKYDYPYVGIKSVDDLTLLQQEALGLSRSTGVYVSSITSDSPADKAGLIGGSRPTDIPFLEAGGDLIIAIDGREVLTFSDFIGYLFKNTVAGDTVVLTVLRGDREIEVELTLDKRPPP